MKSHSYPCSSYCESWAKNNGKMARKFCCRRARCKRNRRTMGCRRSRKDWGNKLKKRSKGMSRKD